MSASEDTSPQLALSSSTGGSSPSTRPLPSTQACRLSVSSSHCDSMTVSGGDSNSVSSRIHCTDSMPPNLPTSPYLHHHCLTIFHTELEIQYLKQDASACRYDTQSVILACVLYCALRLLLELSQQDDPQFYMW